MKIKLDKTDIDYILRMIRKEILHWKKIGEEELVEQVNNDDIRDSLQ